MTLFYYYYTNDPRGQRLIEALALSKPRYSCLIFVDTGKMEAVIKELVAGLPLGQIVASLPNNKSGRDQVLSAVRAGSIRHLVIDELPPEKLNLPGIAEVLLVTNTKKGKSLERKIKRLYESINPDSPIPMQVYYRR